jgi:hypothetical protein
MTGIQIRANGSETLGEVLDQHLGFPVVEDTDDSPPGDEATMAQLDIQQARQSNPGQRPRPGLEWVDPATHIGAPDERADRGTADDVRLDPDASEGPQHTDVCPAPGDAAAQSDAKAQSGGRTGS